MSSSQYSGVGFPGGVDPIGNLAAGDIKIQEFLLTPIGSVNDLGLLDALNAEIARIRPAGNSDLIGDYLLAKGFPNSLEELIVGFRKFLYGNNPVPPEELDYTSPTLGNPTFFDRLLGAYVAQSPIALNNLGVYSADNRTIVPFGDLNEAEQLAYMASLLDGAFKNFASRFVYQYPDLTTTNDSGALRQAQWLAAFANYNQTLADVQNTSNLKLSMQNFYEAFFGNSNPTQFETFFANFVNRYLGNPAAVTPNNPEGTAGVAGYFSGSLLFDKWTTEVITNYVIGNPNSWSVAQGEVSTSAAKTSVLNRIFSLLVLMVTALQKVTASQSDRLGLLTKWQAAYTDLQNKIKFAINNDSSFYSPFANDGSLPDKYNSYNATLTETIKARKDVVGDDAKNLQTQINQSNDAVNQQTSMATSILQELTTIFGSIYR